MQGKEVLLKRVLGGMVLIAFLFGLQLGGVFSGSDFAFAQAPAAVDSQRPDRQTTEGLVIGALHRATDTLSWKGIPYAKPPMGDLRWKAPVAPDKRSAPLRAVQFCEICPQFIDHDNNPATPQVIRGNEDCLYLNIWRPRTKAVDLPVYVWIHGGGNSIQWPLVSDTDVSLFANRTGMVVVTLNYRLGPLGFFNHPALKSGNRGDEKTDSGNFGLLDLIQALSWIQGNIRNFGGNPGNVTIAGESAGGENVISLMASPLAKGLFHRAIIESGVIRASTPATGMEHADRVIARMLVHDGSAGDEKAGLARLKQMSKKETEAYLRSKSAQDLLNTYPDGPTRGMFRFPVTFKDGSVMPVDLYRAFKSGNYNKVPVLTGTNKEEVKLFLMSDPLFAVGIKDGTLFKDPAKAELYDLAARYQSDGWKVMSVDHFARILRSNADQPSVYAYHFLWGAGGMKKSVEPFPASLLIGASHTLEIDFVFGTEAVALGNWTFSPKNRPGRVALSKAMMDYWSQFARIGDPNRPGSGLPVWSPWSNSEGAPKSLLLDADFNGSKIDMSRTELTNAAIEAALKAEPRVTEIKPFWDGSIFKSKYQ